MDNHLSVLQNQIAIKAMKDFDLMFNLLKRVLERDPNDKKALEKIGLNVELSKRYEESIQLHRYLIEKAPYNEMAWYNLAQAHASLAQYDDALRALEFATIINPLYEDAYFDYAELLYQQGHLEKAAEVYRYIFHTFEWEEEAFSNFIDCLIRLNQLSEAQHWIDKYLRFDPEYDKILFYAGKVHYLKGQYKKAIHFFKKALTSNWIDETYLLALAKAYEKLKAFKIAEKYYLQAISNMPDEPQYWTELITFYLRLNLLDRAQQALHTAEQHTVGAELTLLAAAINLLHKDTYQKGWLTICDLINTEPELCEKLPHLHPKLQEDQNIQKLIELYRE